MVFTLQKYFVFFSVLFSLSSCIGKNSVAIKSKSPKAASSSSTITVSSVKILNNQFVLTGTNLSSATSVVIKESGTTTTLSIESQTSSSLTANSLAKLTLAAGKVFEFVVTSASASATFTVDFSLCSSTLGGKYFDCTTTPNDKEVLSYDAVSGKWKPRAVNGLSYQGVWNATTSFPTATTEGDYYIVSVASGSYAVGDWIVYNGTTFEEIDNSTVVTSVFGRTGAISATEGDYVLNKMGDVDFSATPTTNQFLQFNGTNWVGATLSSVETDPSVKTFAKTTLPTCGSSEVLKGDGTSLSCVTVSSSATTNFSGTASRAVVTDGTGALAVSAVTSTELGYVSGVTSAIQTQISAFQTFAKTPIPTCNAGEVLKSNGTTFSCVTDNTGSGSFSGTASRAVVTDGTGVLASSAVTSTEVGYLSGVTSAIQTQFTNVAATAAAISSTSTTLTNGNIFVGSAGNVATSVAMSGDATIANSGALTIAANSVALSTDTTGNYLLNLTASNGLQATAAAGEGTTPNLVLGGALTGATTITQGTNNFLFDLTSTGIFSVLAGANGLSVSNLGVTTLTSAVLTTADINGGTLDDVTIGATTRAPGSFTTIAGTSAAIAGTVSAGTLLSSTILGGTTTTSGLTLKTTSGVGTTTADMHFLVGNNGGTEAMTILNNGNVGIGNPTPTQKLSVAGVIESSTGGFKFPDGTTQTTSSSASNAGAAVAWVTFNSSGTILSSFNTSSVTKASTGRFTVNFQSTLSDSNYSVLIGGTNTGNGDGSWGSVDNGAGSGKTTSSVKITTITYNGNVQDWDETYVAIFQGNGTAPIANGQWSQSGSDVYRSSGNVGIGVTSPSPAAILQMDSTSKGLLTPRMTSAQRKAISSPPEGLEVYDTDAHAKLYYNGTMWLEVGGDPIGTIKAWHKSFTNTPSLAWGWVECTGQTLSDADSLYNGQVIPNLNGTPTSGGSGYTGGGRFLRGGTTSGTYQDATTFLRHSNGTDPHLDLPDNHDGEDASGVANNYLYDTPGNTTNDFRKYYVRPVNMTVVWIMKVK